MPDELVDVTCNAQVCDRSVKSFYVKLPALRYPMCHPRKQNKNASGRPLRYFYSPNGTGNDKV